MFNFIKKKQEELPPEPNHLASISLSVDDSENAQVTVDVLLNDYDSQSINALSEIIKVCIGEDFSKQLLNIIYTNLAQSGEEECLMELTDNLNEYKKAIEIIARKGEVAPIIKPSNLRM